MGLILVSVRYDLGTVLASVKVGAMISQMSTSVFPISIEGWGGPFSAWISVQRVGQTNGGGGGVDRRLVETSTFFFEPFPMSDFDQ